MTNHLSQDQFVQCATRLSSGSAQEHLEACAECRAELDRFDNSVALFRRAVRDRIDQRMAAPMPDAFAIRPVSTGIPIWRWVLAASALVVVVLLPFLTTEPETPQVIQEAATESSPDALMNAIGLHLSRTVPAPMEPVMVLVPEEFVIELEGIQ